MVQKATIRVRMNDDKKRAKAMKIVVGFEGITKASLEGDDKSKIAIEGDGLDLIKLVKKLRKKMGDADMVTVTNGPAEAKPVNEEVKTWLTENGYILSTPQSAAGGIYWPQTPAPYYTPQPYYMSEPYYEDSPRCSIM